MTDRTAMAIAAIVELARRDRDHELHRSGAVTAGHLAAHFGMKSRALELELNAMRRARIIDGVRGAVGSGYRLSRTPKAITVQDIVEAVDPHVENKAEGLLARLPEIGAVLSVFRGAAIERANYLSRITIADLVAHVPSAKKSAAE